MDSRKCPNDSNIDKNRIPESTELFTLRKLDQGERDCSAIRRRYQDLLHVIEGVRSELIVTQSSVDLFKNQRNQLQDHMDQMNGLIHPIRHTSSDVLRYIFEWAHEIADNPFKMSTVISHVCLRWREISLKTSHLWTKALVSLRREPKSIKAFWSRTVERAKAVPVTIIIEHVTGSPPQEQIMEEIPLARFAHIEHIEFRLETLKGVTLVHSGIFPVLKGRVDHLELRRYGNDVHTTIHIRFLKAFPSLTSLTLENIPFILFFDGFSTPTIIRLTLKKLIHGNIRFHTLMTTFPNVEDLNLEDVCFIGASIGEINLPNLRSLRAWRCSLLPWQDVRAPSIDHLSIREVTVGGLAAFLPSHPTVLHLDIICASVRMHAIVKALPKLTELTTEPSEVLCDRGRFTLHKVQNLNLYHSHRKPMSLALFERIVQSRFLPPKNKENDEKAKEVIKTIPSLTILVDDGMDLNKLEWRASDLLSSALEVTQKVYRIGGVFYSYAFTWT